MTLALLLRRTGGVASCLSIFNFFVLLWLVVGVVFWFSFSVLDFFVIGKPIGLSSMSLFPLGVCFSPLRRATAAMVASHRVSPSCLLSRPWMFVHVRYSLLVAFDFV